MGIHKNLDALATKYVNYISKYSSIDERELNLVQQLVYAKIKQEFFSLKYEHILLEDKIGELALLIAYTKIAQNKNNFRKFSPLMTLNYLAIHMVVRLGSCSSSRWVYIWGTKLSTTLLHYMSLSYLAMQMVLRSGSCSSWGAKLSPTSLHYMPLNYLAMQDILS